MNNSMDKSLALTPHRLFSLWDMIRFLPLEFHKAKYHLEFTGASLGYSTEERVTKTEKETLLASLKTLKVYCQNCGLNTTVRAIGDLEEDIDFVEDYNPKELAGCLKSVARVMQGEYEKQMFAYIPASNAHYFERDDLYGQQFHDAASPEINAEIKAAGNCIAADLSTAAVFHLMRVAEFGIRALVVHLGIPISNGELQYEDWHGLIEKVEAAIPAKIKETNGGDRGDKAEAKEFYYGVMGEFRGFKDVWRNSVMHTRSSYTAKEAIGVFERVQDFMQRLAKRISLR